MFSKKFNSPNVINLWKLRRIRQKISQMEKDKIFVYSVIAESMSTNRDMLDYTNITVKKMVEVIETKRQELLDEIKRLL